MSRDHSYSHRKAHSPSFPSLHLRHNSSNPSVALPTSQFILQPFRCFHLCHSSFSNPSFASPTSQALHLIHLASRPLAAVLPKGRSTANSGTKFAVLLGTNRCGSFPLLSACYTNSLQKFKPLTINDF